MDSTKEESDDDGYIPAGLVNKFEKDLDGKDMRNDEIMEFYNTDKLITSARPEKSTTEVFADLSEPKPVFAPKSTPTNHPYRIVATRQQPLPFVPRTDLYRSNRPIPRLMQHRVIQPVAMPVPPMLPVPIFSRPMLSQGSVLHYSLPNSAPPKMQPQLQIYNPNHPAAMQPPIFAAYPTEVIVVSQAVPFISHATKMLPYEPKLAKMALYSEVEVNAKIANEHRKHLKIEENAKLKAEKLAQKAILKEKREAEKLESKKPAKNACVVGTKFANFSKDMFVIRLKDVDSFDRNNEIWRIDNHILIQKFCGVPSLRAPARQFQSTNKLSGYDARATWRLFIIDPENVEVDSRGSEITVNNFPSLSVLRKAKKLAELKDEEFKSIEKHEFIEKLNLFEAKQLSKRAARKQRKSKWKPKKSYGGGKSWGFNKENYKNRENREEEACREVVEGLLDTLDKDVDESKHTEHSISSDESVSCEEGDDAGSLITLYASSDSETEEIKCELYDENDVPAVGLELTVG